MAASTPKKGRVQVPGLMGVAPGRGEIMMAPVSVCHQVSTMGHLPAADLLVIPHPGFGVDRFADGAEEAEGGEVVGFGELVAGLDEGADGGGGGVEDGDAVLLDHLPEAAEVGVVRGALVHDLGDAVGEGAVGDVGVAGDPADVGGAPVDVVVRKQGMSKMYLLVDAGADEVAAGGVEDALGFAGRAGGVENEEGVLGVEGLRGVGGGDLGKLLVPPEVAAFRFMAVFSPVRW